MHPNPHKTLTIIMPATVPIIALAEFAASHSAVLHSLSDRGVKFESADTSAGWRRGALRAFRDYKEGALRINHFTRGSAEYFGYESVAKLHRRAVCELG